MTKKNKKRFEMETTYHLNDGFFKTIDWYKKFYKLFKSNLVYLF